MLSLNPFQKLSFILTGRQQDTNLAALYHENTPRRGSLLNQSGAFGESPNRFDSVKSLQQIGTQLT